jgi:hypothetical protein
MFSIVYLYVVAVVASVCLFGGGLAKRRDLYDTTGVIMVDDITFPKVVPNDRYNVLLLVRAAAMMCIIADLIVSGSGGGLISDRK